MLIESGKIVALADQVLWVETLRRSACGSCAVQSACGHGLLNRMGSARRHRVRVLAADIDIDQYQVGDTVEIAISETVFVQASLVVYLLPLLLMLVATLITEAFWPTVETAALIGAGSGLLAGLLLVRLHAFRYRHDTRLQPKLYSHRSTSTGVEPLQLL
ncbi:MAG: SoxR reducing system RseC family protein [Parahaliea sp.]